MKCPNCKDKDLQRVFTKQGVDVDYCLSCHGIWLDRGEIYYFTKSPTYLRYNIEEALKTSASSPRLNPRTNEPLVSVSLFDMITVEYCPKTGGIWLDGGELEKLPGVDPKKLNITLDKKVVVRETGPQIDTQKDLAQKQRLAAIGAGLAPLPNLFVASGLTLAGLYALLVLLLILCVQFLGLTPVWALSIGIIIAVVQFIAGPFLLDLFLRLFFKISWLRPEGLPEHLKSFIEDTCKDMRFPRMGVIQDGSPQAFTYGHHPNNARIVISQGLIDLLGKEELEAVVAHEIGHIKHWDMLIMTVAQIVPLALFFIYRTLTRTKSSGKGKGESARYLIAIGSYILYIISEYLVLWFSRVREYFADRFSGEVTRNPNALASALVKIGYGLAGREPQAKKEKERQPQMEAIGALGIFDSRMSKVLAVCGYSPRFMGEEVDKDLLKEAMKWDFWNPWAIYYEFHSTHPLIAKRLNMLSEQAVSLKKEPYIIFDRKRPESFWDEFFVDLLVDFLPTLAVLAAIFFFLPAFKAASLKFLPALGILGTAFGLGYLVNVLFSYSFAEFPEFSIAGLLKKVKVSSIRPVPCALRGRIIGRGVPGLIWSDDFVLQDDTGIIFLDYRQPLGIWEFFFGLLRAKEFINEDVIVTGWYRRAPVPFIELKTLIDSRGRTAYCYVWRVKLAVSVTLIILGIVLMAL